jgi:hypothetical protein
MDLGGIREQLRPFYSDTGRPSVDRSWMRLASPSLGLLAYATVRAWHDAIGIGATGRPEPCALRAILRSRRELLAAKVDCSRSDACLLWADTAERSTKISVRFAAKQSKSRRSAFGHFPPPGCFAPTVAIAQPVSDTRTQPFVSKKRQVEASSSIGVGRRRVLLTRSEHEKLIMTATRPASRRTMWPVKHWTSASLWLT